MISPATLRAAVTLAETRHFGRAAERLYLSQPAFSQQIAGLERDIAVKLFERHPRGVRLTDAGSAFITRAHGLLAELDAAVAEARQVADGAAGELTIGYLASDVAEPMPWFVDAYRKAWPGARLRFAELSMSDQFDRLLEKNVDVAFLRLPVGDERILVRPLYAEPRVAAVPVHHRFADADHLTVGDLFDEPFPTPAPPTPPDWRGFWTCDVERGEPSRRATDVRTIGECLAAVAYLDAVDTWPLSTSRALLHPGVRFVPLSAAYSSVGVAQRRDDERPGVRAFCDLAVRVTREHVDVVEGAVLVDDAPTGTPVTAAR